MAETQDLAELEMAFAKDPTSNAFVALSAAYLQQGRFMEAMVVCKKGIKSQPDNVEGRLLLAKVYAEQGKVPKAIEEVKALLEQKPGIDGKSGAGVHFFLGQLHERSGRFEEAIESFKEALRKDRGFAEATAALKAKGVDWSPGPSAEELAAAEAAKRAAEDEAKRKLEEESRAAEAQWKADEAKKSARPPMRPAGGMSPGTPATGGTMSPPRTNSGAVSGPNLPPVNDPAYQGFAGAYGMFSGPVPVAHAQRRLGPGFTFGLGALLLLVVAGVITFLVVNKGKQEALTAFFKEADRGIKTDTSKGHREAVKALEQAIKIDDGEPRVVASYALSLAILAFERGDKEHEQKAKDAAKRAMKVADERPESVAAQMIVLRSEGKGEEGLALAKKLAADENALPALVRAQVGKSYASLGKIQDMVKTADALKSVDDVGAQTFVGEAYRRIGDYARARIALDSALKNVANLEHDPARAMRALVILEDDDIANLRAAIDDLGTLQSLGKDAVGTKQRGYAALGRWVMGKRLGRSDKENEVEIAAARPLLVSDPELPLFEAKLLADGDPGKAIELAQQAIKLDRYRLSPYLTIVDAATHAAKPQWAVADAALADAAGVFGDNLELGIAKAARQRDEGKYDEAIATLKGMLAKHDVAEVYREIAKVFLRKEDIGQAVGFLKTAAEKVKSRSPATQANIYTWLGRAYAQAGDHGAAKDIYAQSLAATTEYTATYYWIAVTLRELGEKPAAKDACTKYLRNDGGGTYADRCKKLLDAL